MGSLFFAFGSAVGAAVAWLIVRGHPHPSTGFALNGIACGLLGALLSATRGTSTPAIVEAGFGFLTTAAPLTLCMTGARVVGEAAGIFSADATSRRQSHLLWCPVSAAPLWDSWRWNRCATSLSKRALSNLWAIRS